MTEQASDAGQPLLPGAAIGVVGGGQLGRYFVLEARRLGYRTWVLDPDPQAPAMQIAEHALVAAYDDAAALEQLGKACSAVTVEFENVPASSLELLSTQCRVAPGAASIQIAQDRDAEKRHALEHGLTPVPYASIASASDVAAAVAQVGLPAILKTSRLGYDGKGQSVCHTEAEVTAAYAEVAPAACVLERRIDLAAEISVVLARASDGDIAVFPIAQNVHVNGILSTSTVPANQSEDILSNAQAMAIKLARGLNYEGVLAVEFFVDSQGQVLFNEMAPRPHNSGHYTLDATVCSQFEQQLRVLCRLPLGSTRLLSPVCMLNLLGDVWGQSAPDWSAILSHTEAHLHLYGKSAARQGRKMGHLNCLEDSAEAALATARTIDDKLRGQ